MVVLSLFEEFNTLNPQPSPEASTPAINETNKINIVDPVIDQPQESFHKPPSTPTIHMSEGDGKSITVYYCHS